MNDTLKQMLEKNNLLLGSTMSGAANKGYRVEEIEKAALGYIAVAESGNLNVAEFKASLQKAASMINQSLSLSAISMLEIKADEAKV